MQRFLIPIIILGLAAWSICAYMVFFTPPQSDWWVLLFLAVLFISLETTLGLAIHFLKSRCRPNWQDRREILHESLAAAFPPTLTACSLLFLRYFAADSAFNVGTLLLSGLALEVYITRKT